MTLRTIPRVLALALILLGPAIGRADDSDVLTAAGTIERIDRDGRIYVGGHAYVITEDTEIFDQLYRTAVPAELVAGVPVELTYENQSRGATAKTITATLMR